MRGMTDADLTYHAEALGQTGDPRHIPRLVGLCTHPKAYVREGAVLGLSALQPNEVATSAIAWAAKNDESPGVRHRASEALEWA